MYEEMGVNRIMSVAAICVWLFGCGNDIENVSVNLDEGELSRLKEHEPIHLTRAMSESIFDIDCQHRSKPGSVGYYLTSNGTRRSNDKAKWKCAREMEYLNCPSLAIVSQANTASVVDIEGSKSDYSKSDIEKCVTMAIEIAPSTMRPTSERAANEDSWR